MDIGGEDNTVNLWQVAGDYFKYIINTYTMNNDDVCNRLCELANAITNLSETISKIALKQKDIDAKQNEALVSLAKAAENNSLAYLNMSNVLFKNQELIEQLIKFKEQASQ